MFAVGRWSGQVEMSFDGHVMRMNVIDDPTPEDFRVAMEIARDLDWIAERGGSLIDCRRFKGSVHWGMVRDLRSFAPWSQPEAGEGLSSKRCAYLFKDPLLAKVLPIIRIRYPRVAHKAFVAESEAMDWLGGRVSRAAVVRLS